MKTSTFYYKLPAALVLFCSFIFVNVFAATKTFTGPGNFSDNTKWNGSTLPVAGDNLQINGTCTFDNAASNLAYGTLNIGFGAAGTLNWPVGGTNTLYVTNVSSSTAASALDMTNGGTLKINGTWTSTNLTFTPGAGTVEIQSAITLPAAYATYNNLTINASGATVTIGVGTTVNTNLTINNGTLSVGAFSLAVTGTAAINGSGSTLAITSATGAKSFGNLTVNNSTFTNSANAPITINGNLQNNGTFTQGTGMVTFTGNSSNTISGSSTTAFGGGITVNKGATNANILDVQCVITMLSGGLTLTNGTFKLSSASTITPFTADISTAPYLIPSTAGIWCDGGTISASANNWSCDGLLRVSGGTVTIGTASDMVLGPKPNSTIWVEGGNLNISGRISNPTFTWIFNMTGGTMTLGTVGNTTANRAPFYMDASGCSFSMSGGTIVIQNPGASNWGYYNMATSGSGFTGGTLQIGNGSTPTSTIGITSTNAIYNLNVNSANVTAQLQTNALTVSNNVTITAGTLDANNLNMSVGNDWTDNGTFIPGTGRVTFNSSKLIQNITKAGGETFYKLTANSTGNLQLNNDVMVTNTLSMSSGFININGHTLTLGNNAGAILVHGGATATAYGGTFKRWWPVGAISSSAGNLYGLFPVGTANDYRPIVINSTANPTTAGYITGIHTDAVTITDVTYTDNEGNAIQRIQNMKSTLTNIGVVGGTYTIDITYTCLSATGNLTDMKLETYTGSVMGSAGTGGPTIGPVTAPTVERQGLTVAQLSNDFVIGTKDKVNTPLRQYFYSRKSGNWTDATAGNATWSYVSGGAGVSCDCAPGSDGYAVISAGHTVSVNSASTVHYVDINSTAILNGTANLTVNFDLTTYGSGQFSPTTGTWQVSRDLYVVAGSSSSLPSGNMTVSNDLILNGTLAFGGYMLTVNGSHNNIIGTGSMTGTGTFRVTTGNREITAASNLTINPTFSINGSITVANAGTMTLLGNLTGSAAGSTWSNDDNSTLNVAGTVLTTGTLNAFGINNTVNYNGGGAQTIKIPTNSAYYNLTCSNAGTKTLAGTLAVTNLFTISNAAIVNAGTNNFNGSGGLTMNNTSRLILADISLADQQLPAFAGAYTLASGTTIEFAGAGAQNANGIAYQNLDITGNNAASSLNIANVSTIAGNLTLTNQAQMNSNAVLTITGNLSYGSSQTSTIVNTVTVNGTSGASFTAGTFDMNGENFNTYSATLGAGSTLLGGAGNLTITTGDWTNNGGTFTPGTGMVIFNGAANQTIGGSAGTTFYNLKLNNTGTSGNDVITLSKPITVTNVLTLTDGILATDATNLITLTNPATTATSRENSTGPSFVKGPIRWNGLNGAGPFIFPTGAGTSKWAKVAVSGITSATDFIASYTNTAYSNVSSSYLSTAVTPTLTTVSSVEYWDVARASGTGNAAVTLYWENASTSGINSCASNGNLKVAHYNSSSTNKWENANSSGTVVVTGSCSGSSAGTVTSDVMTSFSPFTFGSGNSGVNPLPIELLNFNAVFNGTTTDVSWETASEINNNYFTVERSADGVNFTTLSTMTSKALNGNSTSTLSYALNDPNTVPGVYYYRLKQTDFDFKYTYSNIVAVTITNSVDFSFDLAPNPNDGAAMEGFITTPYNGMVTFKVYNIAGNRLALQDIQVKVEEKNPFKIPFKDRLEPGTYIVIAILNGDLTKKKLMMVVR